MISTKTPLLLKDTIQNELNVTVQVYDGKGNPIIVPGGTEAGNCRQADHDDIVSRGASLGYKLEHPVIMIVASLETNYNYYLNMNLGYESATNDAKYSIIRLLKEHVYMNKQDLVSFVENHHVVLLKAVEDCNNIHTMYRIIRKLSEMIRELLKSYRIFRYYIAPGEVLENFDMAHHAWLEALESISFAQKMNLDHPIVTQDDVFYHTILSRLPKEYRMNVIGPRVRDLLAQNSEIVESLIQCFDTYAHTEEDIRSTLKVADQVLSELLSA